MSPIEIDPLTGTPKLVPDKPVTDDFTAPGTTPMVPLTSETQLKEKEQVLSGPMKNLIDDAAKKNAALNESRLAQKEVDRAGNAKKVEQLRQIENILRDGGMDTMSQSKSMVRIREVLGL